jgi:hypothetical protein
MSDNAYSLELLSEWRNNGGQKWEILAKPFSPQVVIRKFAEMMAK